MSYCNHCSTPFYSRGRYCEDCREDDSGDSLLSTLAVLAIDTSGAGEALAAAETVSDVAGAGLEIAGDVLGGLGSIFD